MFIERQLRWDLRASMSGMMLEEWILVDLKLVWSLKLLLLHVLDLHPTWAFITCVLGWSTQKELKNSDRSIYLEWILLSYSQVICWLNLDLVQMPKQWKLLQLWMEITMFSMVQNALYQVLELQMCTSQWQEQEKNRSLASLLKRTSLESVLERMKVNLDGMFNLQEW